MADYPLVWPQTFHIRAYEVGPDERASVLTVADLFQEAAGEHARAAGVETFDLDGSPGTWVLNRLRLQIDGLPAMRQSVEVETWPSGHDRLRAFRDYILRGPGGQPLVRGTTSWLVMHVGRRRPVRLPQAVHDFGPPDRPRALTFEDEPAAPEEVEAERTFAVRRSDLDRVGHANNVRFVEWALEGLDSSDGLADVDVVYRAEAVYGDRVVSRVGPLRDGERAHELARASDGQALAYVRTRWA